MSMFSNLINKFKVNKTVNNIEKSDEYAFSLEEIDTMEEENHQKIKKLKKNIIGIKEHNEDIIANVTSDKELTLEDVDDEVSNDLDIVSEDKMLLEDDEELTLEEKEKIDELLEEINSDDQEFSSAEVCEDEKKDSDNLNSYINLSKENQDLVMKSWNSINLQDIDRDILNGKDILNHNYNISYGEEASKFVFDIRKKYEIVICYLIGFNNEKSGIFNKTIFSSKMDDEWKYLESYVKLLEKIRNFRK